MIPVEGAVVALKVILQALTPFSPLDLELARRGDPIGARPSHSGRRPKWDMRQIVNAIFYVSRAAGQWRMGPKNLPSWQTVDSYFRKAGKGS